MNLSQIKPKLTRTAFDVVIISERLNEKYKKDLDGVSFEDFIKQDSPKATVLIVPEIKPNIIIAVIDYTNKR